MQDSDVSPSDRALYVVYDTVAATVVGPIIIERHDAPAVRSFTAVLKDDRTALGQAPHDYSLLFVGHLLDDGSLLSVPPRVVLSGRAWASLNTETK